MAGFVIRAVSVSAMVLAAAFLAGCSSSGGGGGARDICGQVLERLIADGHADASDSEFRDKLVAHFGRLPHR